MNIDYQLTATILQLIVFIMYVLYVIYKFGMLESISASTYKLEGSSRVWFLAFLGSIGLLNLAQPMEMYGALTMALLWFTGTTINHRSKSVGTRLIHFISAGGAITLSFVGLFILHGMWEASVLLLASIPIIYHFDSYRLIWWTEIVAFGLLIGHYFLL